MTGATEIDGLLFQALKVRGFADDRALAAATGLDLDVVVDRLAAAETSGEVKRLTGRFAGVRLTSAGDQRRRSFLQERRVDGARLRGAYEGFLEPNRAFKQLVTDWQTSDHGEGAAAVVVHRLAVLDVDAQGVVAEAAGADPRFARYGARLAAALERVRGGDLDAVARPMTGSYHDVWMELHEDLLSSLGRARGETDGD